MFTGLVQDLGEVVAIDRDSGGATITIRTELRQGISPGDSIAVNGVCLTATLVRQESFVAEVMHETLRRSSLGQLQLEDRVNLELALRAGDRLGGHIVQGHVDGTATITEITADGFAQVIRLEIEPQLSKYLVEKGSITIEGVSLTIAEVGNDYAAVSLIPETLQRTTFGGKNVGDSVNIEVDVLAKYIEKMAQPLLQGDS